jgi:TPP-dependent indolepyruvate ferredoxin oxidoreductase alpha subunit
MRQRIAASGRPFEDPACAGCSHLGTFRALRRAGVGVQGGLGCDPAATPSFASMPGRWAAVSGVEAILRNPRSALDAARGAGASLFVVADCEPSLGDAVEALLAAVGVEPRHLDPRDARGAEACVAQWISSESLAVVVALAPCTRERPRGAAVEVLASRCNRCGSCVGLGCTAIADEGADAMCVDAELCTGCGLCVDLCRGRALRVCPPRAPLGLAARTATPGC